MLMSKQVILTILVISIALGTVAEFQLRMVQFRSAAYRALVHRSVGVILRVPSRHCFPEIIFALPLFGTVPLIISRGKEENDHAGQRERDRHLCDNISPEKVDGHNNRVDQRHVFHLDRNQEIQHHLHIREAHGKSQEDGKADVVSAEAERIAAKIGKTGKHKQQKRSDYCHDDTEKDIDIVPEISPGLLQRRSNIIVKKQHDHGKNIRTARRNKQPAHKPPDLPVKHNLIRVQRQIKQLRRERIVQNIPYNIGNDDISCQMRNGITPKFTL